MIRFENVSYRYPFQSSDAVADLTFEVAPGRLTLVTGPSGCGKTTLMRLANGLCPHYYAGGVRGRVSVDGVDTVDSSVSDLAKTVGTLFQDPEDQFFALNVKDEIDFSLKVDGVALSDIDGRRASIARRMGIESLLDHSISALSEGQKQRVAMSAIMVKSPRALILDEPSANLDPEATERLAAELARLKSEGYALLVVDHRLHWLDRVADEVIVMQHGRIVERGAFDLLNDDDLRERYGLRQANVTDVRQTLPSLSEVPCVLEAQGLTFDYEHHNHSGGMRRLKRFLMPYAPQRKACLLDNVGFRLGSGVCALIGENGSGKTTLARLITGLNKGSGVMRMHGRDVTMSSLMKRTGLVLQNADHQLQMQSVQQELVACLTAAGRDKETEAAVDDLLATFALEHLRHRHPQSLSGGEKQRLVIACALAKDPDVLILDEPTSGLDGNNMQRVADVLKRAAQKGKAILLITHDLELLALCAQGALRMHELKTQS